MREHFGYARNVSWYEHFRHPTNASWYHEYWYEREHWPGLAFLVARLIRSLFGRLSPLARQLLTIADRPWVAMQLSIIRDLGGLALIVSSFIAGAWIADYFRLPIPGGVMGMIIMLSLLRFSVIPVEFVRRASAGLLYLLPVFFVPLYVEPFSDLTFWGRYGPSLLPLVIIGAAAMLFLAHLFASRLLRR